MKKECFVCYAFLLFLSIFMFSALVSAGPAAPDVIEEVQPDGTVIEIRAVGDEFKNWQETTDGYPVVKNNETQYWEYGALDSEKKIVGSGIVVKNITLENITIEKIKPSEIADTSNLTRHDVSAESKKGFFARIWQKIVNFFKGKSSTTGNVIGPAQPSSQPITGTQKILVVLVNFADRKLNSTETNWSDKFFSTTIDSVKKYYDEVSYGQFNLMPVDETFGTVNDGIVVVNLTTNHPNTAGSIDERNQQITKDALIAADSYVNFASFDTNSDGKITSNELHLAIVVAGYESSYIPRPAPSVWAHKWDIFIGAPVLDGKKVGEYPGGYFQFGELHNDHQAVIGTIVHELGHDLGDVTHDLGFPDLYDYDLSSKGVGYWDLMGGGSWNKVSGYSGTSPSYPGAFLRYYAGWLIPTAISGNENINLSLPSTEFATGSDRGVKQILINPNGPQYGAGAGSGEYFLLENRQKIGYDAGLPGTGLLIWHIDEGVPYSIYNGLNDNESRKLVDLEEASGIQHMDSSSSGDAVDPYPGTLNNFNFNYSSIPNTNLYSGLDSCVYVNDISNSSALMSANLSVCTTPIANNKPVLVIPGDMTVLNNSLVTFVVDATDADGDLITYSAIDLPTGATFNSTTKTFNWTALIRPGYVSSSFPIAFVARDSKGATDMKTMTIFVVNNQPPILVNPGDRTVSNGVLVNFILNATDPDGDAITYTSYYNSTLSLLPGATLNNVTGEFNWTPTSAQSGTHRIAFYATDTKGAMSIASIYIYVIVNSPPVVTNPGNKTVMASSPITFPVYATDAEDPMSLNFSTAGLPSGASFTPYPSGGYGIFVWTPTGAQIGIHYINFTATDTKGAFDTETITINVSGVVDITPPFVSNILNLSSHSSVNISWTTDEVANSIVIYGINSTNLTTNISDGTFVTFHKIIISGLSVNTTYYYKVLSCDASNNCANSSILNFKTKTAPDTTPPVIVLLGNNPMTLVKGTNYVEPGATASDDVDGNITSRIVITGSVNKAVLGTYRKYYNVTDNAGNKAGMIRIVNVVSAADTIAPSINVVLPQNITYFSSSVSLNYSAKDNIAIGTCWYNLDSGANLTLVGCANTTIFGLTDGSHKIIVYANDSSGNRNSSSLIFSIDLCVPSLTNTTWTSWTNQGSCLPNNTQVQVQNRTQFDLNNCGEVANVTQFNYQSIACDYCTPSLVNTSVGNWYFTEECQIDNLRNRQNNFTEYDINSCGEVTNVTHFNNEDIICDFCVPSLTNSTKSSWINMTCSAGKMNQSRFWTQFDVNSCGEILNQTFFEYQLVNPVLQNSTWTSWLNISCLSDNTMNQTRNLTQFDVYGCGLNMTLFEYRKTQTCDYCTPSLANTTWTIWTNISCLSDNTMNQTRSKIQYDVNNCGEINNQSFLEYRKTEYCKYDTIAPIIILNGEEIITIYQGSSYVEEGASVMDNIDSGLIATISGSVDTNVIGSYTLTYSVVDNSGNVATPKTRTVNVIAVPDEIPPVTNISALNSNGIEYIFNTWTNSPYVNITLLCSDASSACDRIKYCNFAGLCAPSLIYNNLPVKISSPGISYIFYYANDSYGNTEQIKNYTIKIDRTQPITIINAVTDKGVGY